MSGRNTLPINVGSRVGCLSCHELLAWMREKRRTDVQRERRREEWVFDRLCIKKSSERAREAGRSHMHRHAAVSGASRGGLRSVSWGELAASQLVLVQGLLTCVEPQSSLQSILCVFDRTSFFRLDVYIEWCRDEIIASSAPLNHCNRSLGSSIDFC